MHQDYETKRKNLFDCLVDAEKCIQGTILDQKEKKNLKKKKLSSEVVKVPKAETNEKVTEIAKFRNKESIFKRPEVPLMKCLRPREVPDYKKHPGRWTKYSLEKETTSDKLNASAAFAFLRDMEIMKQLKEVEQGEEQPAEKPKIQVEEQTKITFNKPLTSKTPYDFDENDEEDCQILKFKGSKSVMPEYAVGKKTKKHNKIGKKKSFPRTLRVCTLQHLCAGDEESAN